VPDPRAYVKTFGCESNRADTEAILRILSGSGIPLAPSEASADAVIVNSCTVRGETERKVLKYASSLPGKHVIVTGCMAAVQPALIRANAPSASIVSPNNAASLPSVIREGRHALALRPGTAKPDPAPFARGLVYTIPISRGCTGSCSYCIVRLARGQLMSTPPARVAMLAEEAVRAGAHEIRLAAQDTGVYGADIGSSLPGLLGLVTSLGGDFRGRVGMFNPPPASQSALLGGLLGAYSSEKVYRFAHMPLQSGSGGVLAAMGRRYTPADFLGAVSAFRGRFPDVTIATDIIVGYPGESDEDFGLTVAAVLEARPGKIHIARFSPRPHTPAASLPQVPEHVKKRRSRELAAVKRQVQLSNNERWVGSTVEAFVFGAAGAQSMAARMDNYKPGLITPCSPALFGTRVTVEVDSCSPFSLRGSVTRR